MKLALAAALVLGMLSAVAAPAAGASPKKEKKAPDPDKRICKSQASTASRIPTSTCHTRAEWDELARQNADAAQSMMASQPANSPR